MPAVNGSPKPKRRRGPKTSSLAYSDVKEARELAAAGHDWEDIAGLTGFPSGNAARMAVDNWLQRAANEMTIDQRREALREAVDGYNLLILAWFPKAKEDLGALSGVLRVMAQRDRIKGLDRAKEDTGQGSALVIGGSEEEYIAGLDRVIADPN